MGVTVIDPQLLTDIQDKEKLGNEGRGRAFIRLRKKRFMFCFYLLLLAESIFRPVDDPPQNLTPIQPVGKRGVISFLNAQIS